MGRGRILNNLSDLKPNKSCCICQFRTVNQVLVGDGLYSDFDVDIEHRCSVDGERLDGDKARYCQSYKWNGDPL